MGLGGAALGRAAFGARARAETWPPAWAELAAHALADRMTPERLVPLREQALRDVTRDSWAWVDTRPLLPRGFGQALYRGLEPFIPESGELTLTLVPSRFDAVGRSPLEGEMGRILAPQVGWLADTLHGLDRAERGVGSPLELRVQLRVTAPGRQDSDLELWHVDGTRLTATTALLGRGTLVAPNEAAPENTFLDHPPTEFSETPLGVTLILRGESCAQGRPIAHSAPSAEGARIVLVAQG